MPRNLPGPLLIPLLDVSLTYYPSVEPRMNLPEIFLMTITTRPLAFGIGCLYCCLVWHIILTPQKRIDTCCIHIGQDIGQSNMEISIPTAQARTLWYGFISGLLVQSCFWTGGSQISYSFSFIATWGPVHTVSSPQPQFTQGQSMQPQPLRAWKLGRWGDAPLSKNQEPHVFTTYLKKSPIYKFFFFFFL